MRSQKAFEIGSCSLLSASARLPNNPTVTSLSCLCRVRPRARARSHHSGQLGNRTAVSQENSDRTVTNAIESLAAGAATASRHTRCQGTLRCAPQAWGDVRPPWELRRLEHRSVDARNSPEIDSSRSRILERA